MNLKQSMTIAAVTAAIFLGCSGGGGDASFSTGQTIVPVDVNCTTPATLATYITLQSGDAIVKDENATVVKIYHDTNGTKKVCLDSGAAHIVR